MTMLPGTLVTAGRLRDQFDRYIRLSLYYCVFVLMQRNVSAKCYTDEMSQGYDSTTPLLKELHWLRVEKRDQLCVLVYIVG